MVWFKFTERHDWRATRRSMRSFAEGVVVNVPRRCAEEALALKKGFLCDRDGNPLNPPTPDEAVAEPGADATG